jgi:Flp pilus assembly protein CpaB
VATRAAFGSVEPRQARDGNVTAPAVAMVRRRSRLPNGRTVAGGFLVAAAAVIVFGAWLQASGNHGHPWVVARRPLAAGWTLQPGDLTTSTMRLPASTGARAFGSPAALVGRTLAAPVATGELVQSGDLVPAGGAPVVRPVAVTVDAPDTATLSTGELVDVLVTNGTSPSAATDAVVYGARVLDISRPGSGLEATDSGTVVTLGVHSFPEVQAVVHASRTGNVSVVAGESGDGRGLGPGATPSGRASPGANTGSGS